MIEVIPTKSDDLLAPPPPMPLLVDVRQAGAALGCGRTLIYQLMADGKLAMVKVGRLTRISVAELQAFVTRQTLQARGDIEDDVIARHIVAPESPESGGSWQRSTFRAPASRSANSWNAFSRGTRPR